MEVQCDILRRHIEIAAKYGRPVTIHCVGAWGHLLEVINTHEKKCKKIHENENEKMGVDEIGRVPAYILHSCNSMKLDMVQGFSKIPSVYFSLSGRYSSAAKEGKLASRIALNRLLLGIFLYLYLIGCSLCFTCNEDRFLLPRDL
jgi:Tat protein secretion system quality control protein TatD with DNase activity